MNKRSTIETAKLIDVYAQEWLRINNRSSAKPKELMPYLIERGVFNRDHRQGLPLRNVLRKLDELGKLDLIRGLQVKRGASNRQWFFERDEIKINGC